MTTTIADRCAGCGRAVRPREGIPCYLCGSWFHCGKDDLCGAVLPNPRACCGLVYVCDPCLQANRLAAGPEPPGRAPF